MQKSHTLNTYYPHTASVLTENFRDHKTSLGEILDLYLENGSEKKKKNPEIYLAHNSSISVPMYKAINQRQSKQN